MSDSLYANWRSLHKPKSLEVDQISDRYGKFVVKPLERGFGTTLGNSLRRVLLSSLQGAAVTHVKVEGVLHEFHSIHGIIEDVTEIVLNIKGLLIQTDRLEPFTGTVDESGTPGQIKVVKASDIRFSGAARILNPDHVLCTITGAGRFTAEMTVGMGKGYVPADKSKTADFALGTIPVDASHSPIKRVKFAVTNARVGNRTDYDKLVLEIYTNGSVHPRDALAYAAKILKEQLSVFINFQEVDEPSMGGDSGGETTYSEALYKRVDELNLSVRAANCLQNAGIEYIWQLVEKSEGEMLKTKNFGRKSLNEIRDLLTEYGLSLGMKLTNFPKNRG